MKAVRNVVYYTLVCIAVAAILTNSSRLLSKVGALEAALSLRPAFFPEWLLAEKLRTSSSPKFVFIYSDLDCQECVASYLRILKGATRNVGRSAVQVIGCGEQAGDRFRRYARVYRLSFPFVQRSKDTLLESLPDLKMPALILIDADNRIREAWRADAAHLRTIAERVANCAPPSRRRS